MPTLEAARRWGLGYAFDGEGFEVRETTFGPLFGDPARLEGVRFGMFAEEQTWRRMATLPPGSPDIWIGWYKDSPPEPFELARADQLPGWSLKMANGQEWNVPVVRRFDVESQQARPLLPAYYDIDEDGRLVMGEVLDRHRWLWDLTQPAWDAMVSGGDVTDQEALATAGGLFSANYVVNAMELICLKAFSQQISPAGVVSLAIDFRTWQDWNQKKTKGPASPSLNGSSSPADGPPEDSPIISQPGLT